MGEPKSLISKGGKNALNCNQVPSLEFVSDKNRLDCFAFARNDAMVEFEDNECNKILLIDLKKILRLKPQNDVINKTVTNLFPYFPISLSLKKDVDSSLYTLALNGYDFVLHPLLAWLRMTKSKECKLGSLAQH